MNDPKQSTTRTELYDDSVLFDLRTGLLRTLCSHQHDIEELGHT